MNAKQYLAASIAIEIARYSSHKQPSNHFKLHGLSICIETPKGQRRRPDWPEMPADYGFIKKTEGADGDAVDVFIGPHRQSEMVYVIDQCNEHGSFDEHKVMLGFTNYKKAVETYKAAYSKGWKVGKVTPMTIQQFKSWLKEGDKRSEIQSQVSRYSSDMFDDAGKPRLRPVMLAGTGSYAPVPQTWATSTNSPHIMSHQSQMPQDGVKQPWHMSIHEFAQHHAKNPGMINGGLSGDDGYHAHEFIKKHFGPETYRVFKFSDQARKQHIYNIAHAMRTGQPVHPDAIAHYPRDIVPQQHSQGGGMHYSASVDRYSETQPQFGLPPIPENYVRLTHFFANSDLKKKFLSGEPFKYNKHGNINYTTDGFSNNDDVHSLLQTGKTGPFERGNFGQHVLIMDVPHTEHRLHSNPQWADGQLHNGHIAGVYDRESGQFHSNKAYGTAPQYKPRFQQKPSQNRPNGDQQPAYQSSHETQGDLQKVRPDDVWSASSVSSVHRYGQTQAPQTESYNLTDDHHSKLGDYISKPENMLNGYKALRTHGINDDTMLTGDDQNVIMLHAGALGNDSVSKHIWGDAYDPSNMSQAQPEMPAHRFMMKLGHGLAKHGNEAKKQQASERAEGAKVVAFKNNRSGLRMLLHPAVRSDRTSDWQLSTIGSDGRPSGHYNPDSFSDGLHQALGVHHQPYWNHHGFEIEWTDRDGTKAPYSIQAEVERYAKQKTDFSDQPSLLHSAGGRWITIGAEEGEDGEKHGGQRILIGGDGKMKTGHFAGKTFGQAFGDKNPNTTHDEPGSKPKQKSLFDTRGHRDQRLLFGDDATPDDMVLTPSLPEAQPKPPQAPEQSQPQQQGLFGDLPKSKAALPRIEGDSGQKPKQNNLFDTHGNANQMDLFGDGFMSDDMVYKPQGQSQEPMQQAPPQQQGIDDLIAQAKPFSVKGQGYNRNVAAPLNRLLNAQAEGKEPKMIDWLADELRMRLDHWSKIEKPQGDLQPSSNLELAQEQPSQNQEPLPVSPMAKPEEPEHVDHNLSLGEGDQQKLSDDDFSKELNHPGLRAYLLKQARKMTNDPDAAEDIVQEAMIKAWNSRKNFDPSQSFQTWMHSILRRTAINEHRDKNAKKRGGGIKIQSMDAPADGDESENLHGAIGNDLRRGKTSDESMDIEALRAAIPKLEGAQKRVVELFLEGNSLSEVARQLGISQAAVGQAMKRAHATLREMLGDNNYALNAIVDRYRIEADRSYYAMCLRVYRYSVFGEVDRYEFSEEDHPRVEHGKSEGGQFTTKMHNGTPIADRPSAVDPGHSLHLSSVFKNPETKHIAQGLHGIKMSLDNAWSEANKAHQSDTSPEASTKTPYHYVDWGKVKGHLDSMNAAHREGLGKGYSVANIANYNGTIPQWLIPKLAGGRKFIDPSLLGSKWTKDTPQSPGENKGDASNPRISQANWNDKWAPGNQHKGHGSSTDAQAAASKLAKDNPHLEFGIAQHPEGLWYVAHRQKRQAIPEHSNSNLVDQQQSKKDSGNPQAYKSTNTDQQHGYAGFTTAKGSTYTFGKNGSTQRNKSYHPEHGSSDVGPKEASEVTHFMDPEHAKAFGWLATSGGDKRVIRKGDRLYPATWNDQQQKWGVSPSDKEGYPFTNTPQIGMVPLELWHGKDGVHGREFSKWHPGNAIVDLHKSQSNFSSQPQSQKHDLDSEGFTAPQDLKDDYDDLDRQIKAIPYDKKTGFANPQDRARWHDLTSQIDKISVQADALKRSKPKPANTPEQQPPGSPQQPVQSKPLESDQGGQSQPQAGSSGISRNFRAGMNQGTIAFSDALHQDLYDLAAKSRSNIRNAGDKEHQDVSSLIERIKSHPQIKEAIEQHGIGDGEIHSFARQTYDHIKSQMKGLKEGEVRRPSIPEMPWNKQSPIEPEQNPQSDQSAINTPPEDDESWRTESEPENLDASFDPSEFESQGEKPKGLSSKLSSSGSNQKSDIPGDYTPKRWGILKSRLQKLAEDSNFSDSDLHAVAHEALSLDRMERERVKRSQELFDLLSGKDYLKGGRMTKVAKNTTGDEDSLQRKTRIFGKWDEKADEAYRMYPELLGSPHDAASKAFEFVQKGREKMIPILQNERLLRQAIDRIAESKNNPSVIDDKNLPDFVTYSRHGVAFVDRYSFMQHSLRHSLAKSLAKFCNKAS